MIGLAVHEGLLENKKQLFESGRIVIDYRWNKENKFSRGIWDDLKVQESKIFSRRGN